MSAWSTRLVAAALLGLAVLGPASLPSQGAAVEPVPVCTVNELLVNSCRPWFGASAGAYPQVPGNSQDQLLYFEQRTGRQLDIAHTYHGANSNTLSAIDIYFATRPKTLLYTNWAVTTEFWRADGSDPVLNGRIDQMAASIKSLGDTRIFLTVHHEPENDLSEVPMCPGMTPKGTMGTAEDYRAMWRNVRNRFDAAGVTNVVWVMNYMNYPPFDCMVDATYPGDDLVDWVVFNGYQGNDRGVSFSSRVGHFYDLLTSTSRPGHDYLSKEWGIVEWGIHNSTQANAYLYYQQAQETVQANLFPRLRFYMVFDNGDYNRQDFSFRVAYDTDAVFDQAEQDAFNQFASLPVLQGDWTFAGPGAPTTPADLTGVLDVDGQPFLTWSASTDDEGAPSYEVLRDGGVVASTSELSYVDAAAAQGPHSYTVRAVDAAGNRSAQSDPVTVTVPDTVAPAAPTGLAVTLSGGLPVATWVAATDNVGVASYDVLRNGTVVGTTAGLQLTDSTAPQGRTHTYAVRARDLAGNTSPLSASVSRWVPDTTAPSAPAWLTATRTSGSRATLTWGPATDNVGVTSYLVYRGTTRVATVSATTTRYVATGLRSGSRYDFRVIARDAAGNRGPAVTVRG